MGYLLKAKILNIGSIERAIQQPVHQALPHIYIFLKFLDNEIGEFFDIVESSETGQCRLK